MTTKASAKKAAPKSAPQADKMAKGFDDVSTFGQQNVDAMVKSSEVAAKAVEGINEEITAFSKKSFEDTVAAAQDLTTAKSATELFEKQSAFATTVFEGFFAQATKMGEIYAAAAKDISAPLNERANVATETLKTYAA